MIPFGRQRPLSCLWLSVNSSPGSCFLLHEDDISPIFPRSLMIPCPPWQTKAEWVEYIYPWKISLTAAVPPAQQTGEEEKPGGKQGGKYPEADRGGAKLKMITARSSSHPLGILWLTSRLLPEGCEVEASLPDFSCLRGKVRTYAWRHQSSQLDLRWFCRKIYSMKVVKHSLVFLLCTDVRCTVWDIPICASWKS
jgi:hypothetical protein